MKKMFLVSLMFLAITGRSQQKYDLNGVPIPYGPQPQIGKPMPEFTLNNITHYKVKKASLKDFKGKWLFLDFWYSGCAACIHSFSKVNEIHKQFSNDLSWILIGENDSKYNSNIRELYEKFRLKQGLEMPSAYDSILIPKWGVYSFPHIIIVDP